MQAQLVLYGIPNCDTVKKARVWLAEQQIEFEFHDFKKQGINPEMIQRWLSQLSLEQLINRKGTTWRALDDAQKAAAEQTDGAIALMLEKPSVIKRPVLQRYLADGSLQCTVGFSPAQYQTLFN